MEWWFDPEEYIGEPVKLEKSKDSEEDISWTQKTCYHDWIPTVLIISTVYDCRKCGVKKEIYERSKK
jgi:hypothetical protein